MQGLEERSVATTTVTVPAPTFRRETCAAGRGGLDGCRICIAACPHDALTARPGPSGVEISVDDAACVRCGACTALCPTSSLQRAFLPDHELRDRIAAAVVPTRPLVISSGHHDEAAAVAARRGAGVLLIPSVLILDVTALVTGLLAGASAIVVAACERCRGRSLDLLSDAAAAAGILVGRPGTVVLVDLDTGGVDAALDGAPGAAPQPVPGPADHPAAPAPALPPPGTDRRTALELLLAQCTDEPSGDALPGFGHVAVDEQRCTMCGACARVCPTGALTLGPDATLTVRDLECVACGMCTTACPERALRLEAAPAPSVRRRRTLVHDELVRCEGCDEPYLPARLLARARAVVAEAPSPPTHAAHGLQRCPTCRTIETDGLRSRPPTAHAPVGVPAMDRRSFLVGSAAATLGGVLGLLAAAPRPAAAATARTSTRRLGMVIDLRRCIGCHACTAVCKAENHVPLGVYRDWVEEYVVGEYPHARPLFLPKLCNHCDDPGCLRACPTGAIFKRDDGIVDLDHEVCIGCRACNQACPYGATFVDPVRHTADKCNLCTHRVDAGLRPACVDVCPSQCRVFGDLDDPDGEPGRLMREQPTTVLRPELGLGPNVHYVALPSDLGEPTTATTVTSGRT